VIKPGRDADQVARTEADHYAKCPGCGQWLDMRDLGQVFEHIHDGGDEPGTEVSPGARPVH
jgi:CRISPR/Cas system type I-B associated protein Csh2 (Cas7 group RAMP superfamily)